MTDDPSHDPSRLGGTVLAEKYELSDLLGRGGMGFVYKAEQIGLGRSVAIKILRREFAASQFERFRTEAMAASRINHPHAVSIYDFGVTGDGIAYLVMEHLRGSSLGHLLEEAPMEIPDVLRIGAQVLSALDEAHACGVIHGDLSANNIIIEQLRDGENFSKIIDFGLARLRDNEAGDEAVYGTAEYIAPEILSGSPATPSSDLYAAGVLLYEMIVGRTPFAGGGQSTILRNHLQAQPQSPENLSHKCPPDLGEIILRALKKDPKERISSAKEMREALLQITPAAARERRRSNRGSQAPYPLPSSSLSKGALAFAAAHTSPFMGREKELAKGLAFVEGDAEGRTLYLHGQSGVGKARLALEIVRAAGNSVRLFVGTADPSGLRNSWFPILALIRDMLELEGQITLAKLNAAAGRVGLPERDVPGLAEAFGIHGPAAQLELAVRRREAMAAALRTLQNAGRRYARPILVFSDIHQYDEPSKRIVAALQANHSENLRIIITSRNPCTPGPTTNCMEVRPLPKEEAERLVKELVDKSKPTPDADQLIALTGGLPASLEQVAGWCEQGYGAGEIPENLVDLVAMRINRLQRDARRVLQAVAIHGTVANRKQVEATLGQSEKEALERGNWLGLLLITEKHLCIPTETVAAVISACTPAEIHISLHADAMSEEATVGVNANHADHCGDNERAYYLFVKAGDDSVRRFDDPGAAHWYRRALRCARHMHNLDEDDSASKLAAVCVSLAEVLRQTSKFQLARALCEEAQQYDPSDTQASMLYRTMGCIALDSGNPGDAIKHLRKAIGVGLRDGDRDFLCQCYLDLVAAFDALGEEEAGTAELQEAIDIITAGEGLRTTGGPARLWRLGLTLARRHLQAGDLVNAQIAAKNSLALANRAGNAHMKGRISALLAQVCDKAGQKSAAMRHRSNALDAMRSLGDRRSTAELLLETLKGQTPSQQNESTRRLAEKLANEVSWRPEAANSPKAQA